MTRPHDPLDPTAAGQRRMILPLECAVELGACGAKAVNLGRMSRAGLPVPAGFVLRAPVLERFIAERALQAELASLEARLDSSCAAAALSAQRRIESLFDAAALPEWLRAMLAQVIRQLPAGEPLAVRSSAAGEDGAGASYAGLLVSSLEVRGLQALEQAVKRVWASRYSARAASYGRSRGRRLAGIAVIVQSQVRARFAGVLFSVSPMPGRAGEMLCEYCAGTAERLVSGEITPERIAIARDGFAARDCGDPPAGSPIPAAATEALADLALTAERLFGAPQDIEWAIDDACKVWLVQSRPITAYGERECEVLWSNANVNENFPGPITPLLYSVASQGYTHYFRNLGRAFGLSRRRLERMGPDLRLIVGVHAGRIYYNLSAIHSILRAVPCGERLAAWFDDFTGADGAGLPQRHAARAGAAERSAGRSSLPGRMLERSRDVPELARIVLKTAWQYACIGRRVAAFERRVDRYAGETAPGRLGQKSLLDLRDDLRAFLDIRLHGWTGAALADAAAMVCYGLFKAAVERAVGEPGEGHLHNSLLKGITGLKSAEPVAELWALARAVRADAGLRALFRSHCGDAIAERLASDARYAAFDAGLRRYLDRWGFRCSGELMLTMPSFQERPGDLLEIVRTYVDQEIADPDAQLDAQRKSREAITARALARARGRRLVAVLPWPSAATGLALLGRMTQRAIGLRERARYRQALLYSRLRRVALAIGERLAARGVLDAADDAFYLAIGELDDLLSGAAMYPTETAALVRLRRAAHARFEAPAPDDSFILAAGAYASCAQDRQRAHGGEAAALHGASVCGGIARGRAQVLADVAESRALSRGDILVTRQTDPGWAPVFGVIGGLVLERGGMLSHGAILAREYGIPTVVGVGGAAERIASGTTVEVDGDHGDVRLLA